MHRLSVLVECVYFESPCSVAHVSSGDSTKITIVFIIVLLIQHRSVLSQYLFQSPFLPPRNLTDYPLLSLAS